MFGIVVPIFACSTSNQVCTCLQQSILNCSERLKFHKLASLQTLF
jgi:hypothetical protein